MLINKILFKTKVGGDRVQDSQEIAKRLTKHALKIGFQVIDSIEQADPWTVMIPIGGDGTVLAAAKEAAGKQIPILGINIGNVGFLTDVLPEMTDEQLDAFLLNLSYPGNFKWDERRLLCVNLKGKQYLAMNDVVISNLYADSIIEYELLVGSSNAGKHKANSIIISTPTGSTAYAMFAGGSIIEPDLDVMEIVPVASMSMSARPMIVGGNKQVVVRVTPKEGKRVAVRTDGVLVDDDAQLSITIQRVEGVVTLMHPKDWNFYDLLRNKLGWNK